MALGQIQKRYSRFILDALTYSKNPKNGVPTNPIQQFSSTTFQKRFNFKNRGYDEKGWFQNPKGVRSTLFLFSFGAAIGISSGKWVTVPYTERSHFVLFYKFLRQILPDEPIKLKGESLPLLHPDNIRACRIYEHIIHQALPLETKIRRALQFGEIEKDLNCEIVVVNSPGVVTATSCGRFGKMYVTSALLRHYGKHEAMIATNFAHEVGHDLARHVEEQYSKLISSVSVIGTSLYLFFQSTYIRSKLPYLVEKLMRRRFLPSFSFVASVGLLSYLQTMKYLREMEFEADYIGLMLASSAGYDHRVGGLYPVFEVGNGSSGESSVLPECFFPVPSGRKRSLRLADPQVANEAISRYPRGTEPGSPTASS